MGYREEGSGYGGERVRFSDEGCDDEGKGRDIGTEGVMMRVGGAGCSEGCDEEGREGGE